MKLALYLLLPVMICLIYQSATKTILGEAIYYIHVIYQHMVNTKHLRAETGKVFALGLSFLVDICCLYGAAVG